MNGIGAIALLVGNVVALYLIYRVAKWAVRKVWPKKKPATPQREPIIIGGYRLENPDEAAAGADAVWTRRHPGVHRDRGSTGASDSGSADA
jgi:hypothetical protein